MRIEARDLGMMSRNSHWYLATRGGEGGDAMMKQMMWQGEVKQGVMWAFCNLSNLVS
jgi:hypothetical protein